VHHLLPLYGRQQRRFLRAYIALARLTRLPLLGGLVKAAANSYARRQHGGYALSLGEAEQIVDLAGSVSLGPCSCRSVFHNCPQPVMTELVVGAGSEVYSGVKQDFRPISKEEARTVLRQCHEQGLVHSMMACQQRFYAICNCCRCCCVPLRLKRDYGIEFALVRDKSVVAAFRHQQMEAYNANQEDLPGHQDGAALRRAARPGA